MSMREITIEYRGSGFYGGNRRRVVRREEGITASDAVDYRSILPLSPDEIYARPKRKTARRKARKCSI